MPQPMKQPLTPVPPLVFSRMLASALDRSDRERRQNSPNNDGRTGFIVDYMSMTSESFK